MVPTPLQTPLTRHARVELPLIGGPMYPCSNPELVAAVSEAGGLGVVQPAALTFAHGYDLREGLAYIRRLTVHPVGMNALIEASSRGYRRRMERWLEVALEEGIRFFITSLGNPAWVVRRVESVGGVVYHDVTERRWAQKALDGGVHGFIAVNRRAGGHAGPHSADALLASLADLGLPVVCAGGVATPDDFAWALEAGYAGVQMGTRFIATHECSASPAYKEAVVRARSSDIVLSERVTGVPVALIRTPWVEAVGTNVSPLARRLLRGRRTKRWMRSFYALRAAWQLRRSSLGGRGGREFWQAGRSVDGIEGVESVARIVQNFRDRIEAGPSPRPGHGGR